MDSQNDDLPQRITPCPKRIREGGIIGTLDLGPCLLECAACIKPVDFGGNVFTCKEYGIQVYPLKNAPDDAWLWSNFLGES
jgi:hypothetical protein